MKIVEPQALRMVRTDEGKALRKQYEAGEVKHGYNEHRQAEMRNDGLSGTVTTVEKDNYIAEPKSCAIRTRAYDGKEAQVEMGGEVANSITTVEKDSMVCETQIRIRKITEKESFRLMGVKDEDFERVKKNQSNSSLRHLAGDSIVTTCLMAIFGQMIDGHETDYERFSYD